MRPLNILLVHERFPPDYGGGGEYVVLETARHLMLRGHRVEVVTTGNPADDLFEGVPLRRLPRSRYAFNLAAGAVEAAARDISADLVHAFTYHGARPALAAARRLGLPSVLGVLALFGPAWREMRGPVVGRAFEAFEAHLMRRPFGRRLFLRDPSAELARRLGVDRPDDQVIAPGISLADYVPAPERSGVLFSSKLEARKGVQTVLEAARALPHIPFHVVGWGPEYDAVDRQRPPNLTLERFRDRLQLAAALGRARIFVLPTKVETFGLVVAEAMASGCAVVSSAPLPFEGERIVPGDTGAFVQAIERLWADPQRCAAAGTRNASLAQAYSWPLHVERLDAVYRELLAPASSPTLSTALPRP